MTSETKSIGMAIVACRSFTHVRSELQSRFSAANGAGKSTAAPAEGSGRGTATLVSAGGAGAAAADKLLTGATGADAKGDPRGDGNTGNTDGGIGNPGNRA